jgi:hypothetical protein
MTTTVIPFDYKIFESYYTNPRNLLMDPSINVKFYHKNVLKYGTKCGNYIMINGKKYYIDHPSSGKFLFSTLRDPDASNVYWDDHYHFGVDNRFQVANHTYKKLSKYHPVIYFHKTVQKENIGRSKQSNCFFLKNLNIYDVLQYDCMNTANSKMNQIVDLTNEDYKNITEIIQRPFLGIQYGGNKRRYKCSTKSKTRKARRYTIHHL